MRLKPKTHLLIVAGFAMFAGQPALAQSTPLEAAAGSNPQLRGVASYIDNICPKMVTLNITNPLQGDQLDLLNRCRAVRGSAAGDQAKANNALDQITPDELLPQDAALRGAVQRQMSAVYGRLDVLRRNYAGAESLALASGNFHLASRDGDRDIPYAAELEKRLQIFGTVTYSGSKQDVTLIEPGFASDFGSITVGADYRVTSAVTAGLSVGYGETKLNFLGPNGSLKSKALSVAGYALIQAGDHLDFSLLAAYSRMRYRSVRPIEYSVTFAGGTDVVAATADSRTNANQFEFSAGGVYSFNHGAWTFGPAVQATYSSMSIGAFDETGAGGLNFQFPHQHVDSLQFAVGGDISYAVSTGIGTLSPYLRARSVFETLDHSRSVKLRYVNDPITAPGGFGTVLTTTAGDRTRYTVGGGIAAQFAHNISAFVDASGVLGLENIRQYTISFGIRAAL